MTLPFVAALGLAALTDLRTRRIPNALTLPGTLVALVAIPLLGVHSPLAVLGGAGLAILLTGLAFVLSRGGFGMGDVKLSMLIGAVLGVAAVPAFLSVACALGMVGALVALARGGDRHTTLAFGPYLAIAACVMWGLGG